MSSKPTLRDIAEATGVSTASVSMILNGKSLERFSSQRVASVLAEAERIGYRTPSARCSGKQIAVLSPSVSNPYHTKMITGIDAVASAAGYQTAIYNTYWNPRTESHLLDTLDYSRVAGIIFAMTPIQTAKVRELSRRVPIVAVGDRVVDFGIDTVDVDNFGAAQLVAKHLIDLGHKRIAYLSTALNEHHVSRMRRGEGLQEAYRLWCPEGSVTICSHVNSLEAEISTPDLEYRSGMELAYKCLRNDKITGIVAINDMVAYGELDALVREGYRVVVVGEPGHPEVEGILGHAGDDAQVVSCAADADALPLKGKVGLVVQTTQTARNLAEVVASITPRVQELRVINTICAATSERQQAAAELANRCDCMVVVGGKNSGNTRRLAQICADVCEHTHHIEEASEIEAAWFARARHIGITAGASTPQEHIERAVERIKELCR